MRTPHRLSRLVSEQQDAARQAGDRVAWADSFTSRADCWAYTAAWLGPNEYIHPAFGTWHVPEDVCWGCWTHLDAPVVRLVVNADCRHYHPRCWPDADFGIVHLARHLRSCSSRLPYYAT